MIHVNRNIWSAKGVAVAPPTVEGRFGLFRVQVHSRHHGAGLPPELARSLRDWLSSQLGDTARAPADPDEVRLAVDDQRQQLQALSAQDVSEDFRAGLAWADTALRAIADVAEQTPPVPPIPSTAPDAVTLPEEDTHAR